MTSSADRSFDSFVGDADDDADESLLVSPAVDRGSAPGPDTNAACINPDASIGSHGSTGADDALRLSAAVADVLAHSAPDAAVAGNNPSRSHEHDASGNSNTHSNSNSNSSNDDSNDASFAVDRTPAKPRTFDYASAMAELEWLAPTPATAKRAVQRQARDDPSSGSVEKGEGDRRGPLFDEDEERGVAESGRKPPEAWGSPEVRALTPRRLAAALAGSTSFASSPSVEVEKIEMQEASEEGQSFQFDNGGPTESGPVEEGPSPPEPEPSANSEGPADREASPAGPAASAARSAEEDPPAPTAGGDASLQSSLSEDADPGPGIDAASVPGAGTAAAEDDPVPAAEAAEAEGGSNPHSNVPSVFRLPFVRESSSNQKLPGLKLDHPIDSGCDAPEPPPHVRHGETSRVEDADLSMEAARDATRGETTHERLGEEDEVGELDVPGAFEDESGAGAKSAQQQEGALDANDSQDGPREDEEIDEGNERTRDSVGSHRSNGPIFRPPLDDPSDHGGHSSARKGARTNSRHFDHSALDLSHDAGDMAPWDAKDSSLDDDSEVDGGDADRGFKSEYVEKMRESIASYFSGRSSLSAGSVEDEGEAGDESYESSVGGDANNSVDDVVHACRETEERLWREEETSNVNTSSALGSDSSQIDIEETLDYAGGIQSVQYERYEGVLGELRGVIGKAAQTGEGVANEALEGSEMDAESSGAAANREENSASPREDQDEHDWNTAETNDAPLATEAKDQTANAMGGDSNSPAKQPMAGLALDFPQEQQLSLIIEAPTAGISHSIAGGDYCPRHDRNVEPAHSLPAYETEASPHINEPLVDQDGDQTGHHMPVAKPQQLKAPPLVLGHELDAMSEGLSPIAKSSSPHEMDEEDTGPPCEMADDPTGRDARSNDDTSGTVTKASIFQFLSQPTCQDRPEDILPDKSRLEQDQSPEGGRDEADAFEDSVPDRDTDREDPVPLEMNERENEIALDSEKASSPPDASLAPDEVGDTPDSGSKRRSLEDLSMYQRDFSSSSSAFLERLRGAAEDRKREVTRARYSMERKEQLLFEEKKERARLPLPAVDEEPVEEAPAILMDGMRSQETVQGDDPYTAFTARPLPPTTTERPRSVIPKRTTTLPMGKTLAPGEDPYVPFKARPMPGIASSRVSSSLGSKRKSSLAFRPHPAQNKSSHVKSSALNAKPPKRLLSGEDASIAKEISRRQAIRKEEARIRRDSVFKARPLPSTTLTRPLVGDKLATDRAARSGKENSSAFVPRMSIRAEERAAFDAERAEREEQKLQDQMEQRNQVIQRTAAEIKTLKEFIR